MHSRFGGCVPNIVVTNKGVNGLYEETRGWSFGANERIESATIYLYGLWKPIIDTATNHKDPSFRKDPVQGS